MTSRMVRRAMVRDFTMKIKERVGAGAEPAAVRAELEKDLYALGYGPTAVRGYIVAAFAAAALPMPRQPTARLPRPPTSMERRDVAEWLNEQLPKPAPKEEPPLPPDVKDALKEHRRATRPTNPTCRVCGGRCPYTYKRPVCKACRDKGVKP